MPKSVSLAKRCLNRRVEGDRGRQCRLAKLAKFQIVKSQGDKTPPSVLVYLVAMLSFDGTFGGILLSDFGFRILL